MLLVAMLLIGMFHVANAHGMDMATPVATPVMETSMPAQPYYGTVQYVFDEEATKKVFESKNILAQVKCNPSKVIAAHNITTTDPDSIFSLGVTDTKFDYTFDLRNCSLYGYKTNAVYGNAQTLTEAQALQIANEFMKQDSIKNKTYNKFGKPVILYRNGGGYPMPVPLAARNDGTMSMPVIDDVEVINDNAPAVERTYYSMSIVFPYVINGMMIYNQYGQPAGVTIEVYPEGVMSFNTQLLPFKLALRTSDKMSSENMIQYIKNGGMSPYYGGTTEKIELSKPEKVLVLFSVRNGSTPTLYLSSGIKFGSNTQVDMYNAQTYTMVVSDYKIGNNMMY